MPLRPVRHHPRWLPGLKGRSALRRRTALAALLALGLPVGGPAAAAGRSGPGAPQRYPEAPRRPVEDAWHGVTVRDDYRWMEQADDPALARWLDAENALTDRWLRAHTRREALQRELRGLVDGRAVQRREFAAAGGRLFALRLQPPRAQPTLVMLPAAPATAGERVVLDLLQLDPRGQTAIDWFVPSPDGRRVAVCVSEGGSEDGTLRIVEVDGDHSRLLPDVVPRASYPTGGGSVAWQADGQAFWYTRYPQGRERAPEDLNFYQQIWWHRLGTPSQDDRYEHGRDFPRIAETMLSTSEDGRWVLADVADGDGGEHGLELRTPQGRWLTLATAGQGYRGAVFGRDGRLYAIARDGSPRGRVVALPLAEAERGLAAATVVVPEGEAVIEAVLPTATRLWVERMVGGPSEIALYTLDGRALGVLATEPVSMNVFGERLAGDAVLLGSVSFVRPWSWWHADAAQAGPDGLPRLQPTSLSEPPAYLRGGRLEGVAVIRDVAVSKDGTRVPYTLLRPQRTPPGRPAPTLLTGYGGYGLSMRPWFQRDTVPWLRHGGLWVQANLRGGGEFGEDWHQAGRGPRKQQVFDDFIAVAEHLIARGHTTPAQLAAWGRSNGGLLVGAAMVQRPDLFGAVLCEVGVLDMLRFEFTPNGAFNTTEFGSVRDPAMFPVLQAYSPLHGVVDGRDYPAVLITTGENDGRVAPWNSYKFAARLQAAAPEGLAQDRPVLLRVYRASGHGMGTAFGAALDQSAETFAFLMARVGLGGAAARGHRQA